MFWFKLSTIILVPHDAIKKKPIVTAQHAKIGQLGRRRCNDSVVAQQLTAAKEHYTRSRLQAHNSAPPDSPMHF